MAVSVYRILRAPANAQPKNIAYEVPEDHVRILVELWESKKITPKMMEDGFMLRAMNLPIHLMAPHHRHGDSQLIDVPFKVYDEIMSRFGKPYDGSVEQTRLIDQYEDRGDSFEAFGDPSTEPDGDYFGSKAAAKKRPKRRAKEVAATAEPGPNDIEVKVVKATAAKHQAAMVANPDKRNLIDV